MGDGGPEKNEFTWRILKLYGIARKVVSAYHPQANGLVEQRHRPVVDAWHKSSEVPRDWHEHLHTVLQADRVATLRSTTRKLFDLVLG